MKAPDIMTRDARVIRADETIATALELLSAAEVRHLPVVDEDGGLVGMLSDRDLRTLLGRYDADAVTFAEVWNNARMPVQEAMTRDPISVGEETDVEDIVELLIDEKVGALPVVDDEKKVLGILSYIDVLRAWQRNQEGVEAPELLPTTASLRDRTRGAQGDWDERRPGAASVPAGSTAPEKKAVAAPPKRAASRAAPRPR